MSLPAQLRVLEVVQSLEKGGRTTRFTDTVAGLRAQKIFTVPLCISKPESWVSIPDLEVLHKTAGINWKLVFQIRKKIIKNNINLIHAHCEFSQLYASIAGVTCGIKTVATFHRSDLSKYQPNMVNKLIKLFASHFVAVSHDRLSLLTNNLKLPLNKCHVVHGGSVIEKKPTVTSINKARADLGIPLDQLMLLSIGHLGEIKGHQDTLVALSKFTKTMPALHLYIAGDGAAQEKQKLTELVNKLQINENVTFLGQINNAFSWLEACDIFIQPSVEEAFGLVFVEAGAKAKPVIATTVGGIKEIIVSKETGLLVLPSSPKAVEHALAILINSPPLRQQYGENGYKRITEHFSLTNMVNKYTDIFNQAVN
ncbi:glycosyltransferase family 4 protein [Colwellia psychrerythraea]|uniref:Glycosyl transferase, group 1 family protein n=1 Tax=Colwellia psychrerythraea (strain 34H / ATCC BAA-681) TaxID=167879 RepID=Q47U85_COLP3|nr:glycosyltransferase family 4 protein [Colwellia psychrerythraea]AAZ28807.1 glycosyl transferase, group 1 family protein [Colwellia psychrerythraea 34H]